MYYQNLGLLSISQVKMTVLICIPYIILYYKREVIHLFHIFEAHFYFLLGELPIHILDPFLLLFMLFMETLYILGILGLCLQYI